MRLSEQQWVKKFIVYQRKSVKHAESHVNSKWKSESHDEFMVKQKIEIVLLNEVRFKIKLLKPLYENMQGTMNYLTI